MWDMNKSESGLKKNKNKGLQRIFLLHIWKKVCEGC